MSFPTVGIPDEDEKARIREMFFAAAADESIDTSEIKPNESEPIKRRRGRPPGSKNRPKPSDYAPYTPETERRELPTLETPPLTQRDQKEVAKRLAGILTGVTGVAAVVKPYLQMTEDEAESIATPLSTYLIRQEATSAVAKQVLDEYDLAAFVIALAAYVVRVYLDAKAERDAIRAERTEPNKPRNITPATVGVNQSESGEDVSESGLQSQEGTERPVSRFTASVSERGWTPSDV